MSHLSSVAPEPAALGAVPSFAIDRSNRCLWRERDRLDMPPKAFDVLDYLWRNPGRLVSQDEILDQVWPNRFVQPEIVKTYIRTLRRLLDDDVRRPRFIETRPRSGYRFLGELLDRPTAAAGTDTLACALTGRGQEMATLGAAFVQAQAGQRGCVLVSGAAGLGKSALLDAFTGSARRGSTVLTAIAYGAPARGAPEPLSLAIALLQDLTRQIDPATLAQALAAHAPSWRYCLGLDRSPAPDRARPGWWPQAMIREACSLLEHLAGTTTIVLSLDDLQWADPDTVDLLVCLGLRRYSARLLIVATFRHSRAADPCPIRDALNELLLQGRATEIALLPFACAEAKPALQAGFRGPFKVVQGGGAEAGSDGLAGFERSIEAASPAVRAALEAGSIAGPRFCAWAVARILGKDLAAIEDLLSHLAATRQYVQRDGSYTLPDGKRTPVYRFRHPAGHDAMLSRQPPAQRSQRFGLFGQLIIGFWGDNVRSVAEDVSRCFRHAGHWPGVIVYNRLAARNAAEQDRPMDAVRLLTEALNLSAKLPAQERVSAQVPIRLKLRRLEGRR